MRASHALLLAALAVASLPVAARADRFDARLKKETPEIREHLRTRGHKNVGVLRFLVKVGKGQPRFDNAPFNGNLPVRLENLLIMHGGPEEKVIGVIRDASTTAAEAKVGNWFADEKERRKLFDVKYDRAWGEGNDVKQVAADAFLFGLVEISADRKTTTVSVNYFTRDALSPEQIARFVMDTDRNVLGDLGLSFAVGAKGREALAAKRSQSDVDRHVLESLGSDVKPSDVAGVEVAVLVDGKATPLEAAEGEGPRWKLTCPPQDRAVAIRLRNTTDKTMAAVVKLNGISTFDYQTRTADQCRKWVLKAGKSATLRGFYTSEEKVAPFRILVGDDAKRVRAELGDRAGLLEIDVFAEGAETSEDDDLLISARGLPPSKDKEKAKEAKAESYKAVRASLLKDARLKIETKGKGEEVIVADVEAIKAAKIATVDFDGHLVGRIAARIEPR